jgi:cytosine deaminase
MTTELSAEEMRRQEERVKALRADPAFPDDLFIILTLQEAVQAMLEGNAAVGAVLVDPAGRVVQAGHARMFFPRFRSDLHAEMDVLTEFEQRAPEDQTLKGYTLYSSLEPCEMCMIRLINSGVSRVRYAAGDEKGKTQRRAEWAAHWRRLAEAQEFSPAQCAPALREIAWDVFAATIERSTARLLARR